MDKSLISVVGRKKEAVARVRLSPGNGQLTINSKPISEYFPGAVFQRIYSRPLEITKTAGQYVISVKVYGGGKISQLGATTFGIARALARISPDLRSVLKKAGFLTRDARVKERRKYGHAQKARAKKQSPKR